MAKTIRKPKVVKTNGTVSDAIIQQALSLSRDRIDQRVNGKWGWADDKPAVKNQRCADDAIVALLVATDFDGKSESDVETYAGDLVAHLMHLCDQRGIEFDEVLRLGRMHFTAEIGDEIRAREEKP